MSDDLKADLARGGIVDTLQYRDDQGDWWQTEATSFQVGDQGELTLMKDMGFSEKKQVRQTQFIECIPIGYWTSVRSSNKHSQATEKVI